MTEQQVKAGQRWKTPKGDIVEVVAVHNTSVGNVELKNIRTGRKYWKGSDTMLKNFQLEGSSDAD